MYDNDDAVHIDIEEFAAYMADVRLNTLYAEQVEAEIEANYLAMHDNLKQGSYNEAFECAQMLRKLYFSKYMDTII
ncbi:MAG: hypothetical protein IKZ94_10095, partial [Lachnospiraceae bacterium]|nr:hypothetical protein [Lachnospiraceae bacterium]